MWLTLMAFLPLFIAGAILPVSRALPHEPPSVGELVVGLVAAFALLIVVLYCAISAWLLLWRPFASRREIYMIAGSGCLTRFDHWLIATLAPQE
jgi:hypothetical protein